MLDIIKQKFLSRKLWAAIAGVCTGIGLIVSGNPTQGAITVITSVIGYIAAEGFVDAAAVRETIIEIDKVVDGVIADEQ